MSISNTELNNREELLINKIIEYLTTDIFLFQDLMYYMSIYDKINPILKRNNLFIVTQFRDCKKLKLYIQRQEEYLKIMDWRYLIECALNKIQLGSK